MNLYRDTYAKINLKNIQENVHKIINKYNKYNYYFGVVKADSYGHQDLSVVEAIIKGGCNYLVVALLEEALTIREKFKDIPILCLGIIPTDYLHIAEENNITITVNSKNYAKEIMKLQLKRLKVHVKINSGMNRLGISSKEEFNDTICLLKQSNIFVEGIYTHIYNAENKEDTLNQFEKYKTIISDINKGKIPIFHVAASETLISYEKMDFVNGCRLGIIMYGFTNDKTLNLQSTFSLYSKIIQINHLKAGDKLGYNGTYISKTDEKIGVVCIGYADGIIRKNKGRNVYINGKEYPIIGNICMDMLFVKIDDTVHVNDTVVILKNIEHIEQVAKHLETIPYEVLCTIGKRVPRIYDNNIKLS